MSVVELVHRPLHFWDTRLGPAVRASLDLSPSAGPQPPAAREVSPCASSSNGIFTPSNTLAESRTASNSVR